MRLFGEINNFEHSFYQENSERFRATTKLVNLFTM